jgi:voltage-gated sodium channel
MKNYASEQRNRPWIAARIVNSPAFTAFIIGVILFAGVLVGVETFPRIASKNADLIHLLNNAVLAIFTVEIVLKVLAERHQPWRYFADGWNLLDFIIVAVCFLPLGVSYVAVLRLFRLLRVIRLITVIPKLQLLVSALIRSVPSMSYVCLLLFLLFYIYAVIGVMLFSGNDPIHFGNLWLSFITLFRIVTLEDWTDIMYLQIYGSDVYQGYNQSVADFCITPKAMPVIGAAYFASFVLLGTMIMLNLVIGVILNAMNEAQQELADREADQLIKGHLHIALSRGDKIKRLKQQLNEMSKELSELS